jgi:hypothetical protein
MPPVSKEEINKVDNQLTETRLLILKLIHIPLGQMIAFPENILA